MSVSVCVRESVRLPMLKSKHPINFIITARSGSIPEPQPDTRLQRGNSLLGGRSEASFLPAVFKVTPEKQPKCEFRFLDISKQREKKTSY